MPTAARTTGSAIELTPWQRQQATMLYAFASPAYLAPLPPMLERLIEGELAPSLELARRASVALDLVGRLGDKAALTANWRTHAPFMFADIEAALRRHLAITPEGQTYRTLGLRDMLDALEDGPYSDRSQQRYPFHVWANPTEALAIELARRVVWHYVDHYEATVDRSHSRWDDYAFARAWPAFSASLQRLPRFTVNPLTESPTGARAVRTGVYLCIDDPHAALQFCWLGHGGCRLREARTFSDIGLGALAAVGPDHLWVDDAKMLWFARQEPYAARFRHELGGPPWSDPALATVAVAQHAFRRGVGRWMHVELVGEEGEATAPPAFAAAEEAYAPTPAGPAGDGPRIRTGGRIAALGAALARLVGAGAGRSASESRKSALLKSFFSDPAHFAHADVRVLFKQIGRSQSADFHGAHFVHAWRSKSFEVHVGIQDNDRVDYVIFAERHGTSWSADMVWRRPDWDESPAKEEKP